MNRMLSPPLSLKKILLRELWKAKVRLAIFKVLSPPPTHTGSNGRQQFGIASRTQKGDIVRSRAESQIADFLFQHDISYVYEPEITLGTQTLHPDFYLLDEDVYLEYWGLVPDPRYVEKMWKKLNLYQAFQIRVISLFQGDLSHLSGKLGFSRS